MGGHQWRDPLLCTDVSMQARTFNYISLSSSMADPDSDCTTRDGRKMFGFSLSSPDLVVCGDSPNFPRKSEGDSSQSLEKKHHQHNLEASVELSLENGITDVETKDAKNTTAVKFSGFFEEFYPEASFELTPQAAIEKKPQNDPLHVRSINVGYMDGDTTLDGVIFAEDTCFSGGDTIRSEAAIEDDRDLFLYQTARVGNFAYNFHSLEYGNYMVDLHFAEIEFIDGPTGVRVFDVFLQEQKVISCLDVYGRVGANKPLVISGLKGFVEIDNSLSIRFEGVNGSPILCGISLRKAYRADASKDEIAQVLKNSQVEGCGLSDGIDGNSEQDEYQKLRSIFGSQKRELAEAKMALEELRKENQLKSKECQEAWKSLRDLQNELMRKSMHVGSLAFAIEGQVKEKSKWFSSLRDMMRKLKIMKMDQIKLSEEAVAYKKCIDDMAKVKSTILLALNNQVGLNKELKEKFIEREKERKELYNKVLELRGNIRVFCRCRPLSTEEIASGAKVAIDFDSAKDGELTVRSNGVPKKIFKFDAVFGPEADQVDVFEDTSPFTASVLDGYNVCIFAYGQTGTGKTFTMEGTEDARGVNFRILEELFRIAKEREDLYRYDISVSVLEVYNEQIRDLLVSGTQPGIAAKRLEIRQGVEAIHHVPGLVEAGVNNTNEVWEVLQAGSNARATGSTNANEYSSRSHCMHCVMVKGENLLTGECTRSKLCLVDLAGSERVAKTEVQGDRLKETQNINRSLSALGDVISALANKSPHIPFRNSKLTHLLQDSLGGDSKTLMFVQISPNESDLSETLCSLNFASRVRRVELGPPKKQLDATELFRYKQMVEKAKQDGKSKDMQIKKMEETIYNLELKMKEKDNKNKSIQDKVRELESQLLIERKLARQHVDTRIAEHHQQQQQIKQQEDPSPAIIRGPLATRPLGSYKNINELANGPLSKEQVTITRPLTENNRHLAPLPSADGVSKFADPLDKENNPEMIEQSMLPKRTGRASICTTARRFSLAPASRRNSLIPLPAASSAVQCVPQSLPLPPCQDIKSDESDKPDSSCLSDQILPEQLVCDSPKTMRSGSKRISSILRRSIQKKVQLKSPMQHHMRKGGVEKVRLSIGSRGRTTHRILTTNGKKVGTNQLKHTQKQKERGWNIGTSGRTLI